MFPLPTLIACDAGQSRFAVEYAMNPPQLDVNVPMLPLRLIWPFAMKVAVTVMLLDQLKSSFPPLQNTPEPSNGLNDTSPLDSVP